MKTPDPAAMLDVAAFAFPPLLQSHPGHRTAVADDDGEDWLGVECLHPLTWLPAPGSAVTRSLLASAAGT